MEITIRYACISGHSGHRNEKEVSLPHSAHRRKRFGRARTGGDTQEVTRTGGDTNVGNHSVLIDVETYGMIIDQYIAATYFAAATPPPTAKRYLTIFKVETHHVSRNA